METDDFKGFFVAEIPAGIDLDRPGIYEWSITGEGVYIGQSRRLRSRLAEYSNNVRKIALGLPYRKSKPEAFRHIHRKLASARESGIGVRLTVLENCALEDLNERERHWIKERGDLNH